MKTINLHNANEGSFVNLGIEELKVSDNDFYNLMNDGPKDTDEEMKLESVV